MMLFIDLFTLKAIFRKRLLMTIGAQNTAMDHSHKGSFLGLVRGYYYSFSFYRVYPLQFLFSYIGGWGGLFCYIF